jgi:GTP pyrophosphokinase
MAPLDAKLKSGEVVEIITNKNRKYPNRDWLKFVKTQKARNKIKQFSKLSKLETIKKLIPRI